MKRSGGTVRWPGRRLIRFGAAVGVCIVLFSVVPVLAQPTPDIDDIIDGMTLEHKVSQMFMVNLFGAGITDIGLDILQTWQPGAIFVGVSNIESLEQVQQLTTDYQQVITAAGGVPLFVATDQEGGLIQRLQEGFTRWPVPMLLTAADDPDLAFRVGQGMAQELRAAGVNMNLAPVADLNTNIENPVIGRRSPGSDPALVGQAISGVIRGMQAGGVLATAKHFPGHGDTGEDSHTTLPTVALSRMRLAAVELRPFAAAIEAEVGAVMVGHLWLSAIDPDAPLPATLSRNVVTGLLRQDMGFDGIIMTDALEMDAVDLTYSPEESAVRAVEAGIDLVLIGVSTGEQTQVAMMQAVVDAVRSGRLSEARLEESVRRVLQAKAQFGILDWTLPDAPEQINAEAHNRLVVETFQAGVTLAYDRGDHIPLRVGRQSAILYPGNRAQIGRDCAALGGEAFRQTVRYLAVNDTPTAADISAAVDVAARVDTVIVWTRDAYANGDLAPLVNALPPEKTVVVALVSPYDWLRFPQISAYLVTYSPMDAGVTTACEILFGLRRAVGRLSVTLAPDLAAGSRAE